MGLEPNYIIVDGQTFSKTKLALDNHVYKNCNIDDCDLYYSGGQYELLDTHITNSRLILNHPAKGIYNALQIFKMKSPGSRIITNSRRLDEAQTDCPHCRERQHFRRGTEAALHRPVHVPLPLDTRVFTGKEHAAREDGPAMDARPDRSPGSK